MFCRYVILYVGCSQSHFRLFKITVSLTLLHFVGCIDFDMYIFLFHNYVSVVKMLPVP